MSKQRIINGMTSNAHKEYAFQSFYDIFSSELEKRGYNYKYGAFHRKHGMLYQSVGLTYNAHSGIQATVYFTTHPFWTNNLVFQEDFNYQPIGCPQRLDTHSWTETNSCWAKTLSCVFYQPQPGDSEWVKKTGGGSKSFFVSDITELIEFAFKDYKEVYLSELDNAFTEEDYLNLTLSPDKDFYFIFPDEDVMIYSVAEKNDIEYLERLFDALVKKSYLLLLEYNKITAYSKYEVVLDFDMDESTKKARLDALNEQFVNLAPSPQEVRDEATSWLGEKLCEVLDSGDFLKIAYMAEVRKALSKVQLGLFEDTLGLSFFRECSALLTKPKI